MDNHKELLQLAKNAQEYWTEQAIGSQDGYELGAAKLFADLSAAIRALLVEPGTDEAAWQELMIKLYDPARDGYESGSEGDFPVAQRALERIAELEQELQQAQYVAEFTAIDCERFKQERDTLRERIDAADQMADYLMDHLSQGSTAWTTAKALIEILRPVPPADTTKQGEQ